MGRQQACVPVLTLNLCVILERSPFPILRLEVCTCKLCRRVWTLGPTPRVPTQITIHKILPWNERLYPPCPANSSTEILTPKRGRFWAAFRSWGWRPREWISALIKDTESWPFLLSATSGYDEKMAACHRKTAFTKNLTMPTP